MGGTHQSEAAVAAGLDWLARHQDADGSWAMDRFSKCNCADCGVKNDIAGTAFGLLPFLGAGQGHKGDAKEEPYARNVERGLQFLLTRQGKEGRFGEGMYEHALATMVLCEAYALTRDPALMKPAQLALDYIVKAQHTAGGWRYGPGQAGDTSVTSWQMTALRTGRVAGLDVPRETFTKAGAFLDSVMESSGGGYCYTPRSGSTPTLTAAGLLCRLYLGWGPRRQDMIKGLEVMRQLPPSPTNMYFSHYATQVMYAVGGQSWKAWNEQMREALIKAQDQGHDPQHPHQKGSWSPKGDLHGAAWGRLGQTSLSLITLEVYYRADLHLANTLSGELSARKLNELWTALAEPDVPRARQIIWTLAAAPRQSVPFLQERLRPAQSVVNRQQIERAIANLDDEDFEVREKATELLSKLGETAEPALRKVLEGQPSPESRARATRLLAKITEAGEATEWQRTVRALEILEHIGSPQSRELLQTLAAGTPEARLTREAKGILERMPR
jgi:hypothetical protein